jgi:RNA polymerase-binding transcription factor DksA
MTAAELNKYRDTLRALGRRLSRDEAQVAGEALRPSGALAEGSSVNAPGDAGDVSVDTDSQDVSLGLMANERHLLAQVTAALQRVEQGTFGTCTICGKSIGKERLAALPYTPYCVEDAREQEAAGGGATGGVAIATPGTDGIA